MEMNLRKRSAINRMNAPRRPAGAFAGLLAVLAVLTNLPVSQAFADPPSLPPLNPPPPSFETCRATGGGAICQGEVTFTDPPAPSGLVCGTDAQPVELVIADTGSFAGTRWYNADGNVTRLWGRLRLQGAVTDPATGLAANFVQDNGIHTSLTVPGNLSIGIETWTGDLRVFLPGAGVLLRDMGRSVLGSDGSDLETGRHELAEYFGGDHSVLAPLCAALGSPGTP